MCKNAMGVINDALRDTDEVYALYEQDELVGLVKVFNRVKAWFFDVEEDGTLDFHHKTDVANGVTIGLIKREFGVGDRFLRRFFYVADCNPLFFA